MTTTAAQLITEAMHLFGITDQTETPTPTDISNNVLVLNKLLRSEYMDGAAQFLIKRVTTKLPPGTTGQPYSFSIGIANSGYLVQADACGMRTMWINDTVLTINRETRQAPSVDVLRTTQVGLITKWHQERQVDNSVLVTCWQAPRGSPNALIEYGGRIAALTAADGSDVVGLPDEGLHDATLLLGRRICKAYGVTPNPADPIFADSEKVHAKWENFARGQQWMRFLRS